ncbi:MAG: hypothetical protein J6X16_04765 [Bacteroidales bacterium]|nr:hypothetical protein [Bacteroidales bacterium]
MKRLLLLFAIIISFTTAINAQSCKISGSNDGSTIVCTSHHMDGNNVKVTVSNDSESTCANVSIVVKVTYANNTTQEFEGRGKSCPDQEASISVPINTEYNGKEWKKYEVTKISGNKCN